MRKQIILTLDKSEIIQEGKPAVGFGIAISDNCEPEDVKIIVMNLMAWYFTKTPPPQPPKGP